MTGVSAGAIATYHYVNYLQKHTRRARVYGMPDSGLFIVEYYSPLAEMRVMEVQGSNLFRLIHQDTDRAFPIK